MEMSSKSRSIQNSSSVIMATDHQCELCPEEDTKERSEDEDSSTDYNDAPLVHKEVDDQM